MTGNLAEFDIGETGIVIGYAKEAKPFRQKLFAMGLTKGTGVTVTRVAPLGDPVEVEVRGFNLSLRRAEAVSVLMKGAK